MKLYRLFPLLVATLAIGGAAYSLKNQRVEVAEASEEIHVASSGDSFSLLDKQYAANESFVYTGDLNFNNDGQAGGLAFGASENEHYFVLNFDRVENHVKLLYFKCNGSGGFEYVKEIRSNDFIGNPKIEHGEWELINPKVRTLGSVNLKVIITVEDEHAYAEFYVEGIRRFYNFDEDHPNLIDLNNLGEGYEGISYQGGYLGANCFNADVTVNKIEIGKSDYSYFSELYRNQYHLQPFSKWTNDPNGLVYYKGYYHVFYQTNPFGQYWGDMYWGHARSRDLIHFEFLPICLFPDRSNMDCPGDGYMWSGCAMVYNHGMSSEIDALGWFAEGGGGGLYAVYTREGGLQDQIIMTSTDEGLTWVKRKRIPQDISGHTEHYDFRDPKIFSLEKVGSVTTRWGMTLSSMAGGKGYFLQSQNLLDWSFAGEFNFPRPECIGVGFLTDNNGVEHAYLTNKSRQYIFGTITFDGSLVHFTDTNGVDLSTYGEGQAPMKLLDFGPDSYASQSFYIEENSDSEFKGKDIVINWFSGDLNASYCTGPGEYANLRSRWNGGFTIPVEYGVVDTGTELRLTQKPITVGNANLQKTSVFNLENQDINIESANPLSSVQTHIFEMEASITTKDNKPITFKVDIGSDEYMEFGWNSEDGYYVDRTNLDDKGINTNIDWHAKYASHILGESNTKTFYVLSDNGGLEVFCENYSVTFYFVTTASPYSTGASLQAGDATINTLKLNEVKSIYRNNIAEGEGVLYISADDVSLDTRLNTSKFVSCWYSGTSALVWTELDNDGVVSYTTTNQGLGLTAIKEGDASFKVAGGEREETINVHVYDSTFNSEFHFSKENIVAGEWIMSGESITGEKSSGNGFLLASETSDNFTYTGQFDILSGVAASLVFRAAADMSSYLVANYDANEKVVKLWSTHGELSRSGVVDVPLTNIVLSVKASDKSIAVTLNGQIAINYTLLDNEPLSGHFGLNVFSGKASFKSLSLVKENYDYVSGELVIPFDVDQYVVDVYNITLGTLRLEPGFYYQTGKSLFIRQDYFDLIDNGTYKFKIVGSAYTFYINVNVNASRTFVINDLTVESGVNVNVYVGNNAITSVSVNGEALDSSKYYVHDYVLTISHECFKEGDNEVVVNGSVSFNVTIKSLGGTTPNTQPKKNGLSPWIIVAIVGGSVVGLGLIAFGVLVIIGLATGVGAFGIFKGKKRRQE